MELGIANFRQYRILLDRPDRQDQCGVQTLFIAGFDEIGDVTGEPAVNFSFVRHNLDADAVFFGQLRKIRLKHVELRHGSLRPLSSLFDSAARRNALARTIA